MNNFPYAYMSSRSKTFWLRDCTFLTVLLLIVGCGTPQSNHDTRVGKILDRELPADNLIIYDRGARKTLGLQTLRVDGEFGPAGPTIIYVFRSLAPGDAEMLQSDGIDVQEFAAYLLPAGELPTREALQRMSRIGPIDQSATDEELAVRFRLGESSPAQQQSKSRATESDPPVRKAPEPEQERSATSTSNPAPPQDEGLDSGNSPDIGSSEPSVRDAELEAQIQQLGQEMNRALADMAAAQRRGEDTTEQSRQVAALLRAKLEALHEAREGSATSPSGSSEIEAPQVRASSARPEPPAVGLSPTSDACADYNRIDPSARASVNRDMLTFAEGFAGAATDYDACSMSSFDSDAFLQHLAAYCSAMPARSLRQAVIAFVCPNGK